MSFDLNSILVSLLDLNPKLSMYVGNLKHESFFHILENFHFMIKDCDKIGKVTKKNKEVLVQFHPVNLVTNWIIFFCVVSAMRNHLLMQSLKCTNALFKRIISHRNVPHTAFIAKQLKNLNLAFPLHAGLFPFKFSNDYVSIQDISEKHFLSAVFASGCYGLIRKPRKKSAGANFAKMSGTAVTLMLGIHMRSKGQKVARRKRWCWKILNFWN